MSGVAFAVALVPVRAVPELVGRLEVEAADGTLVAPADYLQVVARAS